MTISGARSRGVSVATGALLALAFVLVAMAAVLAYARFAYAGRIHPGVRIAEIDVGSLRPADALGRLADFGLDPRTAVVVVVGEERWDLPPTEAGIAFDARATVAEAYAVGRRGGAVAAAVERLRSATAGTVVEPHVVFDRDTVRRAVQRVSDEYDRPARDAGLEIEGTTVREHVAVSGRAVDVDGAIDALAAAAGGGRWPLEVVALPHAEIPPAVPDASDAVASATGLLQAPVVLRHEDEEWSLPPESLAPMLVVTRTGPSVVLAVDEGRLGQWLAPVTEVVSRTARLPRFRWNGAERQIELVEPGVTERRIDLAGTADRIVAAGTGHRVVTVATSETPPAVRDDARAADLGIRELVVEQTSRYTGSPSERVHNIGVASNAFDGLLVPPDAVFSFNDNVGDISAESGYQKTKIIMDGTTQEGVGGGVCQVSTTLFRAAFFAGMPIVERQAHGYRVAYYEQGAPVGLDATVYSPQVDFKFRNDTGAWLLIETAADPRRMTLTFRFYGTRPAREVELEGPFTGRTVAAPPARVEVDPSLAPGESRVIEYSRPGVSVSVTRVVRAGGQELREEFGSHYRPTGLVTAVGPSAAPPEAAAPPAGGEPTDSSAAAPADASAAQASAATPGAPGTP